MYTVKLSSQVTFEMLHEVRHITGLMCTQQNMKVITQYTAVVNFNDFFKKVRRIAEYTSHYGINFRRRFE